MSINGITRLAAYPKSIPKSTVYPNGNTDTRVSRVSYGLDIVLPKDLTAIRCSTSSQRSLLSRLWDWIWNSFLGENTKPQSEVDRLFEGNISREEFRSWTDKGEILTKVNTFFTKQGEKVEVPVKPAWPVNRCY